MKNEKNIYLIETSRTIGKRGMTRSIHKCLLCGEIWFLVSNNEKNLQCQITLDYASLANHIAEEHCRYEN